MLGKEVQIARFFVFFHDLFLCKNPRPPRLRAICTSLPNIDFNFNEKVKNRNILKTKHGATHLEISRKITSEKIKQCHSSEISKSGQLNICRTFLFSVKCFMVRQIFLHFL